MTDVAIMVQQARLHMETNQPFHSELFYRQILALTDPPKTGPERVARGEACWFFATRALSLKRLGEAADWYKLALDADPTYAELRAEMVQKVLLPMNLIEAAISQATAATEIDPENKRAWTALGDAHYHDANVTAARAARLRGLALAPDDSFMMLKLAELEIDVPDYQKVGEIAAEVLARFPDRRGDALHLQAMSAYRLARHAEAIDLYSQAIEAGCGSVPDAKFNRSLAYHALGRYREGWIDHEARQFSQEAVANPFRRFTLPLWQNQPPPARLHLHEEMGYGDTIAMARYAPILVERGYDVCLEVRRECFDLFRRSFPGVDVVSRAIDHPGTVGIQPFDYHIPLISLPQRLDTTVETIPWSGPYLKPNPEKTAGYDAALPKGRRIGICWSSGIRTGSLWIKQYGQRKSLAFKQMLPLFDAAGPDTHWVSLQLGPPKDEEDPGRICFGLSEGDTWDDTAALVECLDLVISVDTSLAHLVGALGKPLWLPMHTEGTWHFMADIEGAPWQHKSPWYPSIKLYRQHRPHEWDAVIARIAADLRKLA